MTTREYETLHLAPSLLQPNPWNSNVVGPEMELRLDESLRRFGCYKPIIVRTLSDGTYEILGGQHRAASAARLKFPTVPVVNLGRIDDLKAKAIGLADNGRYGEDDALRLGAVLKDLGGDIADYLPFTEQDLAGIFAATEIDLDNLGFTDTDEASPPLADVVAARPTITHELMRFKVPVEDRERVQALFDRVMKSQGLTTESDSLVASGMALVAICNKAAEVM